jgi:hypothetical protein
MPSILSTQQSAVLLVAFWVYLHLFGQKREHYFFGGHPIVAHLGSARLLVQRECQSTDAMLVARPADDGHSCGPKRWDEHGDNAVWRLMPWSTIEFCGHGWANVVSGQDIGCEVWRASIHPFRRIFCVGTW